MKTSKLQKLAWVFFALVLTSSTTFAQGWGNRNRVINTENRQVCLETITDLGDDQKTAITGLQQEHLERMAELRAQRRSTRNVDEKNQIGEEMDKEKLAHQNEVKDLLTDDQKAQYDAIQANGGLHLYQNRGWNNYGQGRNAQMNRGQQRNNFNNQNYAQRGNYCRGNNAFQRGRGNGFGRRNRCLNY